MDVSAPSAPRAMYPHVEGVRGLAALYVFGYHLWQTAIAHPGATLGVLMPVTLPWLQYGHFAVAVFIVVSGFCLGLPVARRPDAPFDVRRFAQRRARRLGPAYLAALALSIVPFYGAAWLAGHHVPAWHVAVAVVAHVLLIHNWIPSLTEYLNGPMWSIALECQIYVVFALVLVPLWRRLGVWSQLAAGVAAGLLPHFAFGGRLDFAAPWLLGLFAMGVVGAHATVAGIASSRTWRIVAFVTGALACAFVLRNGEGTADGALWPADLAVGTAVALMLATGAGAQPVTWAARLLSLPALTALGAYSYSLYLLHGPFVVFTGAVLHRLGAGIGLSVLAYGLFVPAMLLFAYAFSLLAERPFLSAPVRRMVEHVDRPRGVVLTSEV